MFFKRQKPVVVSYKEQLDELRKAEYTVAPGAGGTSVVAHGNFAAVIEEGADGKAAIQCMGLEVQGEVAELTDLGFQKIFRTASGRRVPAVAEHLHGLHEFGEDLRQALGLTSLYNEGLGTTNEKHLYDRVTGRDAGAQPKPWEGC
ncbi:MAG: hypothetical protein ACLQBJ_03225 [Bryobacteraceae bacterium]